MTIEEILASLRTEAQKIAFLKEKTINVPLWRGRFGLIQEFDPTKHPVMNKAKYPDIVTDSGIQEVTRVTCDLQRLAVKRMTDLVTGIPVKRVYSPENDRQKEVANYLEKIFDTVAEVLLFLHTEVGATMQLEHIILFETASVYQHFDTLTSGIFATCMLLLDGFLATAKASLFALGDQLLNLFYLFAHN